MTTKRVDPGGGGGIDYTSWASWIAACPASLVSHGSEWRGEGSGSFTAGCTVSGITTSSANRVVMSTAAGSSYRDHANAQTNAYAFNASNGCSISISTYGASAVVCSVDHMTIENLQFEGTNTSAYGALTVVRSTSITPGAFDVNFCIIEAAKASSLDVYGSACVARNTLMVQRGSGKADIAKFKNGAQSYNCTMAVPSDKTACTNGISGQYTASTHVNLLICGCTNLWTGSASAPTFTTCQTSVAGNPNGTTTVTYSTSLLSNITDSTRDFKPVTGSAVVDAGTTDATNSPVDAVGTSRPQGGAYDIGAWELKSAVASMIRMLLLGVG